MTRLRWVGQLVILGLTLARGVSANTVLTPWAAPATGWLSAITSVWVPIIFTLLTVAVLITSRYMGDRDDWISGLLSIMVKASLAANAFAIVAFFVGAAAAPGAAATLEDFLPVLETLE